jgi:hypothetical protein
MQRLIDRDNLFDLTNYSVGSDADLGQMPAVIQEEIFLLQELWQQIISNLSILDSKNICLVSKKFGSMVDKELFPLCNIIFEMAKPLFGKVESYPYTWATPYKGSYVLNFPNTFINLDLDLDRVSRNIKKKEGDIILSEYTSTESNSSQNIEKFIGFRYNFKKTISERNKLNFDKVMSFIDKKAETTPSKEVKNLADKL